MNPIESSESRPVEPSGSRISKRWAGPSRWQRFQAGVVPALLFACASVTILTTAGIVIVLGVETIEFFRKSGVGLGAFLFGTRLNPEAGEFGILPLIWGTLVVAAGSCLIALPIGLLSAIF